MNNKERIRQRNKVKERERRKIVEEYAVDTSSFVERKLELSDEVKKAVEEQQGFISVPEKEPTTKSFTKKTLLSLLFILVNVVAIMSVALMEFGGQSDIAPIGEVLGTFKEHIVYGLIALGLFFVAVFCEGMKRFVLLKASLRHPRVLGIALSSAVVSRYYDYITPLGSGGQPVEIYYMRKKGVPGAIASGIAIMCYAMGLFATVFLTLAMLFWKGFLGVSPAIEGLAIVGIVFNVIMPLSILVFSIIPKVGEWLAKAVSKFLGFLHITKDPEAFRRKAVNGIKEYADCIFYFFGKYSFATILVFIFALLYNIAIYSVPYFVIRMCGVPAENIDYFNVLMLCLICYMAITIFPTPGNSGAAEISFYSIFSSYLSVLGSGFLFWGVMTWRFATYYLFIILGVLLMIIEKIVGRRKQVQKLERNDSFEQIHKDTDVSSATQNTQETQSLRELQDVQGEQGNGKPQDTNET